MIEIIKGFEKNQYRIIVTCPDELRTQGENWQIYTASLSYYDQNNTPIQATLNSANKTLAGSDSIMMYTTRDIPFEYKGGFEIKLIDNFFDLYKNAELSITERNSTDKTITKTETIPVEPYNGFSVYQGTDGKNGLNAKLPSLLNSISDDNMTTQEFKIIAADRLETDNVRIKTKIINFECIDNLVINFVEMSDKHMTTAYIKRANISVEEEGEPTVQIIDDFNGNNTPVYKSYTGDVQICFQAYIASKAIIQGKCKGQITLYIAERYS